MTVSNNMAFSLKLRRAPVLEVSNRLRNVAGILGLTPLLARYPRQLSGGQRQRVAMGRSIVRNPSVFLFDDPLSNLDAKLRVQMRAEIKGLHQRLRTTTVYVTHDQIEAMTMADRIVVMRDGVVEQIGAPLELFDRPANQFVAGFIGSPTMNFITGTVAAEGTPRLLADSGGVYPVSEALLGHKGVRAIYGIRPEHLQIVSAANGNHTDALAAEVVVVEPTGSETQVVVRVGSQELVCVFGERVLARPGEKLLIRPSALLAHLFHPETGQRLD